MAATVVLIAASALAARSGPADPLAGAVSLESGAGSSAVIDRAVHVPAVTVGEAQVRHPKGTPKLPPSAIAHLDIPAVAMLAYERAAAVMDQVDASCGLSWTLLAAIGRVESDHGRYGGAQLLTDGTSVPEIRGPALDGKGPFAMIRDTDAGRLDGDPVWDRAVGPMQFLPSTWAVVGVDADSDGVRSPNDINDAALATAVFLCSAPGSLDTRSGLRAAVYRYNPSSAYVASVLAVERAYRQGDFTMPGGILQSSPITTILSTRSSAPAPGGQGGSDQQGQSKGQHQTRVGHQSTDPTQPTQPTHGSTGSSGPDPTDPPSSGTP
ncbi:lytic transglycosylase domain-containing protein, partial [Nocardioides ungokensis]